MKRFLHYYFPFCLAVLVACGPVVNLTPPPASQSPTLAIWPTPTSTRRFAGTPAVTVTRTATRTPRFTTVPWRLAPTLAPRYDFPAWLQQSATGVVLGISDWVAGVFQLSFFAPRSGDQFDLSLPADIDGYFWLDADSLGWLAEATKTAYIIRLGTGELTAYPLGDGALAYLPPNDSRAPRALYAFGGLPDQPTFYLISAHDRRNVSADGRYRAYQTNGSDGHPVGVTDLTADLSISIGALDEGWWIVRMEWSPQVPTHLAVFSSDDVGELGQPAYPRRIEIYDVLTGQVVAQATDTIDDPARQPCVADPDTAQTLCLPEITRRHQIGRYAEDGITLAQWSADKERVFYTYYAYDTALEKSYRGDLCIYTLSSGQTVCPTEGLPDLVGRSLTDYALAPDEQSVVLHLECRLPSEDYLCDPANAILNLDGSGFQWLTRPTLSQIETGLGPTHFTLDNYFTPLAYLWRPDSFSER